MLADYESEKDACEQTRLTTLLGMFNPSNITSKYGTSDFAAVVKEEASKVKAKGLLGHWEFGWDYYSKETAYVQTSLIGALDIGFSTFIGNGILNSASSGLMLGKTENLGDYCNVPKVMHCKDMSASLMDCFTAGGINAITFEPVIGVSTSPPAGQKYIAKLMKWRDGSNRSSVVAVSHYCEIF